MKIFFFFSLLLENFKSRNEIRVTRGVIMNESRYFEAAQNCERRSYLFFLNGFLVMTFLVLHWYENKYKELQIADLNSR